MSAWIDPATVFALIYADCDTLVWLDGGDHATTGMSYLGTGSITASVIAPGHLKLEPSGQVLETTVSNFLRERLPRAVIAAARDEPSGAGTVGAGFTEPGTGCPLGWVGWLGYELGRETLLGSVPAPEPPVSSAAASSADARHPDAAFIYCDRLVAFDHEKRTVALIASAEEWTPELRRWRDSVVNRLADAASVAEGALETPTLASPAVTQARWRDTDRDYLELIARCQAAIVEGEAYQLCLTTSASVSGQFDPVRLYSALRRASPSHHGGFLRIDGVSLLSSSPERFLSVSVSGVIESKPIKGTRARGTSAADDHRLREELLASEKERAENLMIVDLMRNDIARVSEVGSVSVPVLLAVESYAQVHQLVSTVRGQLAAGRHPIDAVEACFPAGSMTGAPKLRATQILRSLEQQPRGIYAGAFGYFGVDGSIDLAMVIRSIVVDAAGATIGSGGGITASSVPLEELAEVKLKAAVLLAVLGAN